MVKPKTPGGLSAEAAKLFRDTRDQFRIDDAASLTLLANAALSLDRLRQAEAEVKREGAWTRDRFGQVKPSPAAQRIDAENQNVARNLRELGLNLSPVGNRTGPPEGV